MISFRIRKPLDTIAIALCFVVAPYVALLLSSLLASFALEMPLISDGDYVDNLVDWLFILVPTLFIPVGMIYWLSVAFMDESINRRDWATIAGVTLGVIASFAISWTVAVPMSSHYGELIGCDTDNMILIFFFLNMVTILPVLITSACLSTSRLRRVLP